MHLALGVAAGTECLKPSLAPEIQQCFRNDAACGVSCAQEQDIEATFRHIDSLSLNDRLGIFAYANYNPGRIHMSMNSLKRQIAAEFFGTAFLLAAVVGSGIMGERLSGGNVAIALLANTIATGAALVALILTFGPTSGGHFNPAVTFADASQGGLPRDIVLPYVVAQISGAVVGVVVAHAMFGEAMIARSEHARQGASQILSEFIATFGLLCVIWGTVRSRATVVPFAVGAYITAAYWFTASTSFANPAVTIARSLTNTFSGIRPSDVPGFVIAQLAGALAATVLFRWLVPALPKTADRVVVAHERSEGGLSHAHRDF